MGAAANVDFKATDLKAAVDPHSCVCPLSFVPLPIAQLTEDARLRLRLSFVRERGDVAALISQATALSRRQGRYVDGRQTGEQADNLVSEGNGHGVTSTARELCGLYIILHGFQVTIEGPRN
jgi:hypothetical protein